MAAELGQTRLVSLDVFRGMTIAGMVLVNNPGTWDAIYPPLEHAEWNGITPTDFIFPFFLFIVGVAIPIALGKRTAEGVTRDVYLKIISRAFLIFFIGLFMAAFPLFDFSKEGIPMYAKIIEMFALVTVVYWLLTGKTTEPLILLSVLAVFLAVLYFAGFPLVFTNIENLRIPGVLQRIAVCYLITSLIFLHTNWKQLAIIGVVLLFFYWLLMTIIPVPGCEVTTINDKACNIAAYVDRTVFGLNHIWKQAKVYDPEGFLSTIPAVVTTIAGVLTGLWLKSKRTDLEKVSGMFFFGLVLIVAAWCWNPFFPFNKALWTSSYVLYTAGLALCFLGFCYYLIDIKGYKTWTKPFVIFGVNALALFIGSGLMARMIGIIKVPGKEGSQVSLQGWIYDTVFVPLADAKTSSLLFAICFILFWLFLMWLLYRKRIYIKV
jgi:predicted acyltransferase